MFFEEGFLCFIKHIRIQNGTNLFLARTQKRKWLLSFIYTNKYFCLSQSLSTENSYFPQREQRPQKESSHNIWSLTEALSLTSKAVVFSIACLVDIKSSRGITWLVIDSLVFKESPGTVIRGLKQEVDGKADSTGHSTGVQRKGSEQHGRNCILTMVQNYHFLFTKKELEICFKNTT